MQRVNRATLWLVLPLALSFMLLNLAPLREGDLGWHLRLGEAMVTERAIPQVDRWSVGGAGQAFNAAHSWLADVGLYLVWHSGGLAALVLLQALVGTVTVALLLSLLWGRMAPPYAALLTLLGFLILYPFSTARPQIASFLGMALLVWLLDRWRTRRDEGYLRFVPLVLGLWVNLHGAWSMGMVLLAATGAELLLRRRPWGEVLTLLRWSVMSVAATLVNPLGLGLYHHLLVIGTNSLIQRYVSEWQPPTLAQRFTWPFWLALFLALGVGMLRPRRVLSGGVPALLFTLLALRYVRMIPFAALTLLPWLGEHLPVSRVFDARDAYPQLTRALLALLAIACLMAVPWVRLALGIEALPLLDPYFPADAVAYLARVLPAGTGLFTLPEWGGYVIWQLYPQARPLVDGRVEVPPVAVWEDYLHIALAEPGWAERLEHYSLRWLLLSRSAHGALIEAARAAGWRCVWGDANAQVWIHPEVPVAVEVPCLP